jgi:hypothetical protein
LKRKILLAAGSADLNLTKFNAWQKGKGARQGSHERARENANHVIKNFKAHGGRS